MPIYEIQHAIPLNPTQKDDLAQKITQIHSQKFTTPKLFVQVYFTDVAERWTYVGGRRCNENHISGRVRSGPSRTQQDWNEICNSISDAWYEITATFAKANGDAAANGERKAEGPNNTLRSIILTSGFVAGFETGFILPPAGGDVQWLHDNWDAFNKKAEEGDEEMKEMVREVKERGLMDGTNGLKTAAQKLEEMLGWGDSA